MGKQRETNPGYLKKRTTHELTNTCLFIVVSLFFYTFYTGKLNIYTKAAFSCIFDVCPAYMFDSLPLYVLLFLVYLLYILDFVYSSLVFSSIFWCFRRLSLNIKYFQRLVFSAALYSKRSQETALVLIPPPRTWQQFVEIKSKHMRRGLTRPPYSETPGNFVGHVLEIYRIFPELSWKYPGNIPDISR